MEITKEIVFEPTLKCNLSCKMCTRQYLNDTSSELDIYLFRDVLNDIELNYQKPIKLNFGGYGEPLIYKDIIKAIKEAKEKSMETVLTTNGHFLNERMREEIIDSRLDHLRISLNATCKSEYKKLMNSDRFELVESNIKRLFQLKRKKISNIKIGIQILDTKKNKENFSEYRKTWERYLSGDDFMTYRMIENKSTLVDSEFLSDGNSPDNIINRWPCYALWNKIAIDTTGSVYACCEAYTFRDKDSKLYLGDINDLPITKIINSPSLEHIRNLHLTNDYTTIPECKNCTKIINYPNIWKIENGVWEEKE